MQINFTPSLDAVHVDGRKFEQAILVSVLLLSCAPAYAYLDATRVAPHQQQAQDIERLRILNSELVRVKSALLDLTSRRAEHIATTGGSDMDAIDAELNRVLAGKEGLQREIAAASKVLNRPIKLPEAVGHTTTQPRASVATFLPWWDVYRRVPIPSSKAEGLSQPR